MNAKKILFVDNDDDFRQRWVEDLEQEMAPEYQIVQASTSRAARQILADGGIALAIVDLKLEKEDLEDQSGLLLAEGIPPDVPKIIISHWPTFRVARAALRARFDGSLSAVDFLDKAEGPQALLDTVRDVLTHPIAGATQSAVFVAHGHDKVALAQVVEFLESNNIPAKVLQKEPDYGEIVIIEKLERIVEEVTFAVILLTGDDVGYVKAQPKTALLRARQNVIFEWGYLLASRKLRRRRVRVLYQDGVEIPSNMSGVLLIPMDEQGEWKSVLARELNAAGISIDLNKTP